MRSTAIVLAALLSTVTAHAQENEEHEKGEAAEAAKNAPALAAALKAAKISLADGLKASAAEGTPISGKFEIEDGKLQLSVYTMKGDKFFEVVVDHETGKVAQVEPITGGEDLAAAKEQAGAMAKTKRSLSDVIADAEKANPGCRAVSIMPEIENGVAQAYLVLLKGSESKQVEEKL